MRTAVLITAAVLLTGGTSACSSTPTSQPTLTPITPRTGTASPSPTARTPQTSTKTSPAPVPTAAPTGATPIASAMAWVEAGKPADPTAFHTATRDGVATQLGSDVAFVTPTGTTQCMTDAKADGALSCLVDLRHPPTEPANAYGHWIGGWSDFDGSTLSVGSTHADPGPFAAGKGAELAYGTSLRFGDFQCRSDPDGLFCVNFAHRSGVKFADSGVEPLGCLKMVEAPDLGLKFSC